MTKAKKNAKQALLNQYSYTKYDNLGRIEEVGQLTSATAMTQATAQSLSATSTWWTTAVNNSREQITKTVYDLAFTTLCTPAPSVLCQKNLRNRVSYSYVQPSASFSNNNLPYTSATYYSYDIHGNVDVLLQHYNSGIMQTATGGNAFKRIEYKYDLISGKVNEVAYQPGYSDQFYHRYSYDAENKLTKVFTSPDRVVWEQEADYSYYRHGPLARVELGQVGVQGVDYAYTLQGWLKTVNSTAVTATADMGGDGTLSGRKIAADVYGFALHYNSTDYKAINLSKTVVAPVTSTALPAFKDLYNGNIAAMAVTFSHTSFGAAGAGLNQPLLYKYRYDQLNRIKEMDAYSGLNQTTNAWSFSSPLTAYQERVSYDGNGNILTYSRNGDAARTAMDNMTYSYVSGTNKLDKVVDVAADATPANYPNYNDLKTGQTTGNYAYDAIGNLIKDQSEGISSGGIVWNVYGKIASVTKSGVTTSYTYDASGNRISKTTGGKTTWYVRDASGNVMAVYESGNASVNGGNLSQIEVHLYGSSRLGMWTPNRNVQVIPSAQTTTMIGVTNGVGVTRTYKRGQKFFELSNHLGNVLVTVTDRKVAIQNGTTGTILNYVADVVSGGDYYPFGMQMPSRNFSADKYRYGFNGKEKDKDINSLTAYDYGFRIYNPAIGKFLSVDPLTKYYPSWSPYPFAMNRPIEAVDLDGLEAVSSKVAYIRISLGYNPELRKLSNLEIYAYVSYDNTPNWIANNIKEIQRVNGIKAMKACNCPIIYSPNETLVGNLVIEYKAPESPLTESEEYILDKLNGLNGKAGTYIEEGKWSRPLSNALAAQNNAINSAKSFGVNTVRLEKANAAITVVTAIAQVVAFFIREEQVAIFNRQVDATKGVVSILQEVVFGTLTGIKIPDKFLNGTDLSSIANFLLKGEVSYVYTTTPLGKEIKKENLELMNVARSILKVAEERIKDKKNQVESAKRDQLQNPKDNTVNNQGIRNY